MKEQKGAEPRVGLIKELNRFSEPGSTNSITAIRCSKKEA